VTIGLARTGSPSKSIRNSASLTANSSPVAGSRTHQSSTPNATKPWTTNSSHPRSRADATTSASSGAVIFCRSASGMSSSRPTWSKATGSASPIVAELLVTISLHASAMIAPPE